jgi:pyrroloquinoline quinone (PQQ) biosynthesis protein C
MIKITPHPQWVLDFLDFLKPYKDKVTNHRLFVDVSYGRLTKKRAQGALINFYPLVESFPQYMALNLAKVPSGNFKWNEKTRHWLIANIHQERLHTGWWRQMARGFGVPGETLNSLIYPPPEMDAINNYLWRVSTHGSLAEGLSAVNFAVEGPTGEWTKRAKKGFKEYRHVEELKIEENNLEWIAAHATYDDKHPDEALEIIKAYASTNEEQEKVRQAAKRALEYYALALDACYEHFN